MYILNGRSVSHIVQKHKPLFYPYIVAKLLKWARNDFSPAGIAPSKYSPERDKKPSSNFLWRRKSYIRAGGGLEEEDCEFDSVFSDKNGFFPSQPFFFSLSCEAPKCDLCDMYDM